MAKFGAFEQPRSTLRKIEKLKEALDDAGACLSTNDRKNCDAIRALSSSVDHAERWTYTPHVGWYDDRRAFVLPGRVIGRPRGNAVIFPPRGQNDHHRFEFSFEGSHKDWVTSVAEPARYSSCMVLGICMALAAPLLDFLNCQSFGILLSDRSKSAKSTALVVAGSVIGIASENALPNFRTTDAALGELPAAFNDIAMPINELGLLKGSAKDRCRAHTRLLIRVRRRSRDDVFQVCGTQRRELRPQMAGFGIRDWRGDVGPDCLSRGRFSLDGRIDQVD